MGTETGIQWTDATWNPIHGCSKVSPGCAHCYAETLSLRYGFTKLPWTPENAAENVRLRPDKLTEPLRWRAPRKVFVNSMSDLFHELVPDEFIAACLVVMAKSQKHTYQVLTKRPERMRRFMSRPGADILAQGFDYLMGILTGAPLTAFIKADGIRTAEVRTGVPGAWPLPNVWLGTSVENQRWADVRIPLLLDTPAAVRFLSCEPLLERINITGNDVGEGWPWAESRLQGRGIDWVIVGGESGPHARPFDPDWARSLVTQCQAAGAAPFVKQLGEVWGRAHKADAHGGNMDFWPADLRVREFPQVVANV